MDMNEDLHPFSVLFLKQELYSLMESLHLSRMDKSLRRVFICFLQRQQDLPADWEDVLQDVDCLFTLLDVLSQHAGRLKAEGVYPFSHS